ESAEEDRGLCRVRHLGGAAVRAGSPRVKRASRCGVMSKRILITGGAGFVGSHLADALLQQGHHVRIYDNLTQQVNPDGTPAYLDREIEFIQGDMRDGERLAASLSGHEIVFHLGAAVGVGQSMHEIERYVECNT